MKHAAGLILKMISTSSNSFTINLKYERLGVEKGIRPFIIGRESETVGIKFTEFVFDERTPVTCC
jgi:hypothetical protein